MELFDQIDILKLDVSHYFKKSGDVVFYNEMFCNFVHYTDHIFRLKISQVVFLLVE